MNIEKKSILLVEDEVIIAMAESKAIENFGYNSLMAHNGIDAVRIATGETKIDLVLMDIDLGKGMDGTESARQILQKKNIPIVFLTSHSERDMVDRVRGITRYGYVIKNSGNFVLQSSIEMAFELFEANQRLSRSEARMRTLVQTIPDLVWLKDGEGVYITCNPQFELFFGARETDIVGKTDYEFLSKEEAEFFRDHDRRAMEAGRPTMNEEWITYASDGHRALLETIKTPMFDRDGSLIGVLGISRDITERKRVEEALLESENKYRSLVELSLVGVYIIQDGLFRFVNKRFCEIFGYSYDEIVNIKTPDDLTDVNDRKLVGDNIKKRLSGKMGNLEYEFKAVKKSGSVFDVRVLSGVMMYQGRPAIMGTLIKLSD
ncbi:MAG TPA: PAS domain S-box protein [Spirochaetota bacterium]|nr:PAS domain S-box protein [Spirochaetota bacterium]HPR48073.1 PAS domain S-box protein [Spirochaetota bacterium]